MAGTHLRALLATPGDALPPIRAVLGPCWICRSRNGMRVFARLGGIAEDRWLAPRPRDASVCRRSNQSSGSWTRRPAYGAAGGRSACSSPARRRCARKSTPPCVAWRILSTRWSGTRCLGFAPGHHRRSTRHRRFGPWGPRLAVEALADFHPVGFRCHFPPNVDGTEMACTDAPSGSTQDPGAGGVQELHHAGDAAQRRGAAPVDRVHLRRGCSRLRGTRRRQRQCRRRPRLAFLPSACCPCGTSSAGAIRSGRRSD